MMYIVGILLAKSVREALRKEAKKRNSSMRRVGAQLIEEGLIHIGCSFEPERLPGEMTLPFDQPE